MCAEDLVDLKSSCMRLTMSKLTTSNTFTTPSLLEIDASHIPERIRAKIHAQCVCVSAFMCLCECEYAIDVIAG